MGLEIIADSIALNRNRHLESTDPKFEITDYENSVIQFYFLVVMSCVDFYLCPDGASRLPVQNK